MRSPVDIVILACFLREMVLVESCKEKGVADVKVSNTNVGSSDCGIQNKSPYLEVLRGRDGRDGIPGKDGVKGERGDTGDKGERGDTGDKGERGDTGDKGERGEKGATGPPGPNNGGVVYIRWGRTTCPNDTGAELVYEGIVGGNSYDHYGGGANYLCLPKDPQYISTATPYRQSYLYGSEYETFNVIFSNHDHNPPCAVCYTSSKLTKLMIPAKTTCPISWTREYYGYLMAELYRNKNNVVYECVDSNPESIPGSGTTNTNGAVFYFVQGTCNGLSCPPYVNNRAITCVVCTK